MVNEKIMETNYSASHLFIIQSLNTCTDSVIQSAIINIYNRGMITNQGLYNGNGMSYELYIFNHIYTYTNLISCNVLKAIATKMGYVSYLNKNLYCYIVSLEFFKLHFNVLHINYREIHNFMMERMDSHSITPIQLMNAYNGNFNQRLATRINDLRNIGENRIQLFVMIYAFMKNTSWNIFLQNIQRDIFIENRRLNEMRNRHTVPMEVENRHLYRPNYINPPKRLKIEVCEDYKTRNEDDCPVCLESSNLKLDCGHTMCVDCSIQIMNRDDGYLRCPLCRHVCVSSKIDPEFLESYISK